MEQNEKCFLFCFFPQFSFTPAFTTHLNRGAAAEFKDVEKNEKRKEKKIGEWNCFNAILNFNIDKSSGPYFLRFQP